MAETLGSLVDKLSVANIRLWHLEDRRRNKNFPDPQRLAAADAVSLVNKQRNDLMDEIDLYLKAALEGGAELLSPKVKLY